MIDEIFCIEEDQDGDEAISNNICEAINDFFDMMRLIKHSWTNDKYLLKQRKAGYDICNKRSGKKVGAWIGITGKTEYLKFILYSPYNEIWEKAENGFKGPMEVYDFDEDLWVYGRLKLTDISKEEKLEDQREILKSWINKTTKELL
jgi:hypothetical protein